jgi:hypothetical protein
MKGKSWYVTESYSCYGRVRCVVRSLIGGSCLGVAASEASLASYIPWSVLLPVVARLGELVLILSVWSVCCYAARWYVLEPAVARLLEVDI